MPREGGVWTSMSGAVTDVLSRPIEYARVIEDRMSSEYDYTDYYGNYSLRLWAHCPTTVTASHPRFDSVTSEQVGVATPFVGPRFKLLYKLGLPSASPRAFNPSPQKLVTFQVPAGPLSVSEAQVR
ncbi:MAG: hypothetical protein ACR2L3_04185, partial [Actinomycetota bacterium]